MTITPLITLLLVLCLLSSSSNIIPKASARFFPNISSIPHDFLPNATNPWDAFHKFAGCRSGQHLDGLSQLKQYFHNFGYLDNNGTATNLTDDFDNALEDALRTYQRLFHLNVTGELDDRTLDLISRPRCGNADIVNGSTTMNSSHAETTSSGKLHTVSHYAFFPGEPRWSKDVLTYAFYDDTLGDDVRGVFSRAFAKWAEVIPVSFTYTASLDDSDIKIGFFSGDHGDGEPFDGVLGTLAHAFSPPNGRFHLDAAETWIVMSAADESSSTTTTKVSSSTTAIDLESVAVHEIGHLLGLGHSSVEEAIMYPTISAGTRKVTLAGDDVDGIQSLYGSNPSYNSSAAAASTEITGGGAQRSRPSMWGLAGVLVVAGGYYISAVF